MAVKSGIPRGKTGTPGQPRMPGKAGMAGTAGTADGKTKNKVDPELRRQLTTAAAAKAAPIEAVLRLRPTPRSAAAPPPRATRQLAELVVGRVAEELGVGHEAYDFNVFPNLGYFVLSAPPFFVERVADQPEVASASANRRKR
jgi:hypothetical protein